MTLSEDILFNKVDNFINELRGKTYGNFTFQQLELEAGSFGLTRYIGKEPDMSVYVNPFWDEETGIPLLVNDDAEGEEIDWYIIPFPFPKTDAELETFKVKFHVLLIHLSERYSTPEPVGTLEESINLWKIF